MIHFDKDGRASFIYNYNLMEPARPIVDHILLSWLEAGPSKKAIAGDKRGFLPVRSDSAGRGGKVAAQHSAGDLLRSPAGS